MVRDLLRPVPLGIYFLSFATGVVGALVLPTFSVFLAKELGVRPLLVGLPFTGLALASIGYNQWIGHWSDKLSDRRPLVAGFCLVGVLSCAIFALTREYWLVVFSAVALFSLGMVAYSQMLAYSLDYAERQLPLARIPLFNAIVRAQIAIAWVAGPPAGFLLASYFGFSTMYWVAAALFVVVGLTSLKLLPKLPAADASGSTQEAPREEPATAEPQSALGPGRKSLLLCLIAFSLMWCVNNAYLIALPLHLDNNLGIDTEWVGWIMGTAALLEVPVMLLAGVLAARVNLMAMVRLAGVAGFLLYAGVLFSSQLWQLFALQIFNAIFIGVLAGLGVSVVQSLMPGRSGSASALYTNTTHVGNLLSSLQVALVADWFGYGAVFWVSLVIVALAMVAFLGVRFGAPTRSSAPPAPGSAG
ncbi:sugar efflux transporter [Marinimicrobium agarilyticum]|uniref:sugar efflux transporter n=1 Tax=Marinimicrobium agarilyticum TaxID=306546 RepID=UPI000688C567|nr:sugar efflux transporter [Marinimicrobium agarilyticum]